VKPIDVWANQTQNSASLLQPFSQKPHTANVEKDVQIGLYDPAEADLDHVSNGSSVGFLRGRLYSQKVESPCLQL